jgi:hypothetical protein
MVGLYMPPTTALRKLHSKEYPSIATHSVTGFFILYLSKCGCHKQAEPFYFNLSPKALGQER